jgi:hypothetical protein
MNALKGLVSEVLLLDLAAKYQRTADQLALPPPVSTEVFRSTK